MKTLAVTVGIALGVLILAAAPQNASRENSGARQDGMIQNCPTTLADVAVSVANTEGGIAVTLTGKPENVEELQRRIQWMANMRNMMSDAPHVRDHMIDGEVKYESLPEGGRLILTPRDAARLDEFRTQVRSRAEQMRGGNCTALGNMMEAMKLVR